MSKRSVFLPLMFSLVACGSGGNSSVSVIHPDLAPAVPQLRDVDTPVGPSCLPPVGGQATLTGTSNGVTFTAATQNVAFWGITTQPSFFIADSITSNADCTMLGTGDTRLFITLPADATLGTVAVYAGYAKVELKSFDQVRFKDIDVMAESGTIELDGYNPRAGTLCGSLDVTFADGGNFKGAFGARDFCK